MVNPFTSASSSLKGSLRSVVLMETSSEKPPVVGSWSKQNEKRGYCKGNKRLAIDDRQKTDEIGSATRWLVGPVVLGKDFTVGQPESPSYARI